MICVVHSLVNMCLVVAFRKKLGLTSRHTHILIIASFCIFIWNAMWLFNFASFFLPCDSWVHTTDASFVLSDAFSFISDESYYIGVGCYWFCIFYRFKRLTIGESAFTSKRVIYIPILLVAGLLLASGVFIQAPVLLYMGISPVATTLPYAAWVNWSCSIHQPLIGLLYSVFDIGISLIVLFHLHMNFNKRTLQANQRNIYHCCRCYCFY